MALLENSVPDRSVHHDLVVWGPATNGGSPDTFTPFKLMRTPYSITVQVTDADGWQAVTGPTVTMQGSLDGTTFFTLKDFADTDISFTADGLRQINMVPMYVRPSMADGDAGSAVTVRLLVRYDTR